MKASMSLLGYALLGALAVPTMVTDADAQCEVRVGYFTNFCTTSTKVQLNPHVGFYNDWWHTSESGSGLDQAFTHLECKQITSVKTLFSGIIDVDDAPENYICGTGAASGYPIIYWSRCGYSPSCQ